MKIFILCLSLFLQATIAIAQVNKTSMGNLAANQPIKVLELRNYVTKPGMQAKFMDYFETNFIDSQNVDGGFILGQFKVKDAEDNFFWMRGFKDMSARSKYLPEFYRGAYWKSHRNNANAMLLNNDNAYLLKPLNLYDSTADIAINSNEFGKEKGLVVINFYIANTRLPELIDFFRNKYAALHKINGITNTTFWISEMLANDFPGLPVFQDKNLLVTITFYKDEKEYADKLKQLQSNENQQIQTEMKEIVTTKTTVILYPSKKSFSVQ